MTKIAFVQNLAFEYLGTEYLSAVLKERGHQVELFLGSSPSKLIKEIGKFDPHLISFSCSTGIHQWALDCAKKFKEVLGALIILGGPHPTFFPEIIENKAIDIICIGEGEYAVAELADRLDKKTDFSSIENLWVKQKNGRIIKNPLRFLIPDLNQLPFPDRNLYYKKYPFLNRSLKAFFAGRGCPFNCSFCFNHILKEMYKNKGPYLRLRSPENLIAEILDLKNNFGLRTVYLQDDTILLNRKWFFGFLKIYREKIKLPFICLIRADSVNEEIISEMKKSGCHSVFFGIETGDEAIRNSLLCKNIKDSQIIETARLLKKYKIKFRTYNMLGLPEETMEQAFKTVELNIKIKTDYPWCSLFYPYPKTELGEFAKRASLIEEDEFGYSFFRKSVLKGKNQNEISNLQKLFSCAVKFPRLYPIIKRIIKFKPNIIFDFIFLIFYAVSYFKSENLTFKDLYNTAKNNLFNFFFK